MAKRKPGDDAPERTLTQRELNRALLARELLLERSKGSIEDVVEQVGGLQPAATLRPMQARDR